HTLALGGNDKNSVCLTRGSEALLSQHIGDLDQFDTMGRFELVSAHLQHLLQTPPDLLVHDLHPDYATSRYAMGQQELPTVAVQHHHAHATSCMAEHGLVGPVLALTLDGSGFGPDQTIWGGELLLTTCHGYQRLAHLAPVMMPGGEAAVREPWRMATSFLYHARGAGIIDSLPPALHRQKEKLPFLIAMMEKGVNSPLTSSCGRLFDGIAALLDLCDTASFDGQPAMLLETAADPEALEIYPFALTATATPLPMVLDTRAMVRGVMADLGRGIAAATIAGRFHHTLASLFGAACHAAREQTGCGQVVCSGGVFQNRLFTSLLIKQLEADNFTVYTHQQVPTNDGGLALGQAVAGRAIHRRRKEA
ncbi:MAG: carbamoyltransferase HypF, partial [Desulfobulbaceae bacterium]|nr:carbamoyltransferase HypF [Desulfobulbaceae bacterium]